MKFSNKICVPTSPSTLLLLSYTIFIDGSHDFNFDMDRIDFKFIQQANIYLRRKVICCFVGLSCSDFPNFNVSCSALGTIKNCSMSKVAPMWLHNV